MESGKLETNREWRGAGGLPAGCCGRCEQPAVLLWASWAAGGATVGVTSHRRCCCGPVGVLSCSGAAVGVAAAVEAVVGVAAAGGPIVLWVSRLTATRGGKVGGLEVAGFNFAYISNKNDVVWCFKKKN